MANLQQYSKAVVYVNSSVLSEEASVTIKRSSGSTPVKTVAKGYSGESAGSPMTEITVSNAVPAADFELNPGTFINQVEVVELTIFAAGRTLTVQGSIIDDNFSHAVDTEAKLEFNFRGGPSNWE
jgi:hypothetical protein